MTIRGGGHSVPGFGTVDDGVVADLSPMQDVTVDPSTRTAGADPDYEAALEELAPYEEIARQLIAFRIEHELSQTEPGHRGGVSQPAIARLERGEHEPRLATLRKVAHALHANLVLGFAFQKDGERKHLATL